MLQWLRENLKSFHWTLWLVIAAFVLGFVMLPGFDFGGRGRSAVAATVGDAKITQEEFARAYESQEQYYRRMLGERYNADFARQMNLPRRVLEQLIGQKILAAEARDMGLEVTDEEVQQVVLGLPYFKDESGQFVGPARYAELVRLLGYSRAEDFEKELREQALVNKLESAMSANLFVPETAVEEAYKKQVERAEIRFFEVPGSRFASALTVDATEIKSYFDTHREEYRRPEQRVISYLLVDQNRLRNTVEIAPADIDTYYGEHLADFRQEEQVHARHILVKIDDQRSEEAAKGILEGARRRVEGGADFAAVARELSEDPGSKDRGGDLGFFGRGSMLPEFEQAAFGGSPNQLVGPVKTSAGLHLVQVLERRPGGQRSLAEVQNQIKIRLQSERAQGEAETKARALAERIKKEKLSSDEQLKGLTTDAPYLVFEKTQPFGQQDPVPSLGRMPEVAAAAFALDKGALSEAVKTARGWVILRLDEIREPRVPELGEVESQVRQALLRKKQQDRALTELATAKAATLAGKSLDDLARDFGVEVKESGEFGQGQAITGLGVNAALTEAAMALGPGQIGGPVASSLGGVLFEVKSRKRADPQEFAAQKAETRSRLEKAEVDKLLAALVQVKYRQGAKIDAAFGERYGIQSPATKKS